MTRTGYVKRPFSADARVASSTYSRSSFAHAGIGVSKGKTQTPPGSSHTLYADYWDLAIADHWLYVDWWDISTTVTTSQYKDHNPYIHTCTGAFSGGTGRTVENLIKFDVIVGIKESTHDDLRQAIHDADPNVKIFHYCNLNNATDDDELDTLINTLADPEVLYLNAVTECVQTIYSTSYTRSIGQRMYSYKDGNVSGEAGHRWIIDYTTSANRDFLVDDYLRNGGYIRGNIDGIFVDNWGPCGSVYHGTLDSGDMDFAGSSVAAPFNLAFFNETMEVQQKALMVKLISEMFPSYRITANVAAYTTSKAGPASHWRDYYTAGETVNGVTLTYNMAKTLVESRGVMEEFLYTIGGRYNMFDNYYTVNKEHYEMLSDADKARYCHVAGYYTAGNATIAQDSDRMKLTFLACHLLWQFDNSYFYYQRSNSTPTLNYYGAQAVQIGDPLGDKTQVDSRTYKRLYDNGISIVRFRLLFSDNFTDSDTYDLGDFYYTVNADGTYGSLVSSVTLANMEGFIGVKNK